LTIAFFIFLVVWAVYLYRFRNNLMGLQHMVTASVIVAMLESLLWAVDYIQYNQQGRLSDAINIIGALFTAGKLTLIRTLILLVALGYSITLPILERRTKIYVAVDSNLRLLCSCQ